MHDDQGARIVRRAPEPRGLAIPDWPCPVKEPFGVRIRHVDAPATLGPAKIAVPVGAVKCIFAIKVLHPLDIGQIVVRSAAAS